MQFALACFQNTISTIKSVFSKQDLKNSNWTNFKTTSIYIEWGVEKKSRKKRKEKKK